MIIIINNYLHKSQITKNSQRWYLLERTSGVFYSFLFILLLLLFFIYLHLSMFLILLVLYLYLISRLLCHVTSTLPWLLRPVKVSASSELDPDYFRLLFLFHLPRALRFWVHIFYPQAFFTLRSFPTFLAHSQHFWHIPDILAQPAFTKVSPGVGSYFLESCMASYWFSKHRPGKSVCLIHSNPQSFMHLKSVFIHVNIANVLLVVKTLIRSAAIRFSSNENIKQQPN